MTKLKTKTTEQSVPDYLNQIQNEVLRKDCEKICEIIENITKAKAKMWGSSIIGAGDNLIKHENGRTLDWFIMGFSPRKANISLYILGCSAEEREGILPRLGKHKTEKGCINIKSLADINLDVFKELCEISYYNLKK